MHDALNQRGGEKAAILCTQTIEIQKYSRFLHPLIKDREGYFRMQIMLFLLAKALALE